MAIYLELEKNLAKSDGGENAKAHSFYKLSKVTGISHNTMSRLRKASKDGGKPLASLRFETIEAICKALDCQISDILILEKE